MVEIIALDKVLGYLRPACKCSLIYSIAPCGSGTVSHADRGRVGSARYSVLAAGTRGLCSMWLVLYLERNLTICNCGKSSEMSASEVAAPSEGSYADMPGVYAYRSKYI